MSSGKYMGQGQKGTKIVVGAPGSTVKLGKSAGKHGGLSGSKASGGKKK